MSAMCWFQVRCQRWKNFLMIKILGPISNSYLPFQIILTQYTLQKIESLECQYNNNICELLIQFKESSKKRSDSPDLTDFYQILVDGVDILNEFRNNDYLELDYCNENALLKKVNVWQKYEFNY